MKNQEMKKQTNKQTNTHTWLYSILNSH